MKKRNIVTPCVGVWIETGETVKGRVAKPRHTLRGCVDWNGHGDNMFHSRTVTPCVGVWIETWWPYPDGRPGKSHPAWVCGLKLICFLLPDWTAGSHPAWVCGLKPVEVETLTISESHTLRGCVDWNISRPLSSGSSKPSHPAWVCGLKHMQTQRSPVF